MTSRDLDRRSFARELVAGTAAAVGLSGTTADGAQDVKPPGTADQLLAVLQAQFPGRLNDEQWKEVRGKIESQLKASQTLREFKLQNSDEPATLFAAYRGS